MQDLLDQRCRPIQGQPPMPAAEVQAMLGQLAGWSVADGALQRQFRFADYHRTMAFVNAVAWLAHSEDHHPDMTVRWGDCMVRFSTHSVGGLSINDFICAAKVNALGA
jgi:4a-hydroxytetrahydrobiopterin dehydratase